MSLNDGGSNECDKCGSYNCESMLCAACVESEMSVLRAENKRLREALAIYADDENWIQGAGVADWIHDDDPQMIARKALEERT